MRFKVKPRSYTSVAISNEGHATLREVVMKITNGQDEHGREEVAVLYPGVAHELKSRFRRSDDDLLEITWQSPLDEIGKPGYFSLSAR